MTYMQKVLLLELGCFFSLPLLATGLVMICGHAGLLIFLFLFLLWAWEGFAFTHYRFCRQEEFLHVLQAAANTQAPIESMLATYLEGRPREPVYRGILLLFVFPGYQWIHS